MDKSKGEALVNKLMKDVAKVVTDEGFVNAVRETLERLTLKGLESFPLALVTMGVAMILVPEASPYRKDSEAVSAFLALGQQLGGQMAEVVKGVVTATDDGLERMAALPARPVTAPQPSRAELDSLNLRMGYL